MSNHNKQIQVWDFRANEDMYDCETLRKFLQPIAKQFVYQLEQGDSGYKHWQGRMSLFKPRRKKEVMNLMEKVGMHSQETTFATRANFKVMEHLPPDSETRRTMK